MNTQRNYGDRAKKNSSSISKDLHHKKLSGVCAGIARHYDYPRLGGRIAAIGALILFPVAAGVAYIVAAILLPSSY